MSADLIAREMILIGLRDVRENPQYLEYIFPTLSDRQKTDIKAYVAEASIKVRLGWTAAPTDLPSIVITLPGEAEDAQYIGSNPGISYDEGSTLREPWFIEGQEAFTEQVAQFTGHIDIVVSTKNGTETAWLSWIVKWLLLRYRREIEKRGLEQQKVSLSDLMPAQEYNPDPVYTRVARLQYTQLDEYTLPPESFVLLNEAEIDAHLSAAGYESEGIS